jgi:hypothetical protein
MMPVRHPGAGRDPVLLQVAFLAFTHRARLGPGLRRDDGGPL